MIVLIVVILLCLLPTSTLCTNCKAQEHPTDENYTRLCEGWVENHVYSASTNAPIATALNADPKAAPALRKLLDHFELQGDRVLTKLRSTREPFVEPVEMPCNIPSPRARFDSVNTSTSLYGWGLMSEPCASELETKPEDTPIAAMRTYMQSIKSIASRVTKAAGMKNWPEPSTFNLFRYQSRTESCKLFHFAAFRVNGRWGINTGITNDKPNLFKEEWHRSYLVEILRLDAGKIVPIRMYMRRKLVKRGGIFVGNGFERNTTTLLSTWGGAPASSLFTSVFKHYNPSLRAAIDGSADKREQVNDATMPSNIAILMVPIVLAAVPIALFAEVDTVALLVYTIATDIISALPLAIKGVELINFGNKPYQATRTWVYGGRSEMDLAAGEMWYAQCEASNWVVNEGRIFLAIAIVAMVLGVVLEVVAKRVYEKKSMLKKEEKEQLLEKNMAAHWNAIENQSWNREGSLDCTCCHP